MLVSRRGHTSAPGGKPLTGRRMRTNDQLNPKVTMYSIRYIALENNALHKFKVNKINHHNRHTDDDGCTIETCLLEFKKSH